ncbi:hypothetical protein TELCIR_00310, partial [Teladorsagia circumcincta]
MKRQERERKRGRREKERDIKKTAGERKMLGVLDKIKFKFLTKRRLFLAMLTIFAYIGFVILLAFIQTVTGLLGFTYKLECCGVNDESDWFYSTRWPAHKFVPDSCCDPRHFSDVDSMANCGKVENSTLLFQQLGSLAVAIPLSKSESFKMGASRTSRDEYHRCLVEMNDLETRDLRMRPMDRIETVETALAREMDDQKIRYKPESLDVLMEKTHFSKYELKYLYQCFKQNCPSGYVTREQFIIIFRSFFSIHRLSDANQYAGLVFNTFDDDRNNRISFSEFAVMLSLFSNGTLEQRLDWLFDLYDCNRRGYIVEDDHVTVC